MPSFGESISVSSRTPAKIISGGGDRVQAGIASLFLFAGLCLSTYFAITRQNSIHRADERIAAASDYYRSNAEQLIAKRYAEAARETAKTSDSSSIMENCPADIQAFRMIYKDVATAMREGNRSLYNDALEKLSKTRFCTDAPRPIPRR